MRSVGIAILGLIVVSLCVVGVAYVRSSTRAASPPPGPQIAAGRAGPDGPEDRRRADPPPAGSRAADELVTVRIQVGAEGGGGSPSWTLTVEREGAAASEVLHGRGSDVRQVPVPAGKRAAFAVVTDDGSLEAAARWNPASGPREVRLLLEPPGTIVVRVTCAGAPAPDVRLRVVPPEDARRAWLRPGGAGRPEVTSGVDGRCRLTVPPTRRLALEVIDGRYVRSVSAPFDVTSGATTNVSIEAVLGGQFRGRVVDASGAPLRQADVVCYLRTDVQGSVRLEEVAATTTDAEGGFVTPAVERNRSMLLKAVARRAGEVHVVQRVADVGSGESPADLGTLVAAPTLTRFRLPSNATAGAWQLTVAALGDGGTAVPDAVVTEIEFPPTGEIVVHGLPEGPGRFLLAPRAGGDSIDGEFVVRGESVVPVELAKSIPSKEPELRGTLRVRVEAGGHPGVLRIVRDGTVLVRRSIGERDGAVDVENELPPGRYQVMCSTGALVGTEGVLVEPAGRADVTASAHSAAVSATLHLTRGGKPLEGVEATIGGFDPSARTSVLLGVDARSAADGSLVLNGLPPDVGGLLVALLVKGSGRIVFVPASRFSGFDIEL